MPLAIGSFLSLNHLVLFTFTEIGVSHIKFWPFTHVALPPDIYQNIFLMQLLDNQIFWSWGNLFYLLSDL